MKRIYLCELWVKMTQSREGLGLKDPVRHIGRSWPCQGLQGDMDWLSEGRWRGNIQGHCAAGCDLN